LGEKKEMSNYAVRINYLDYQSSYSLGSLRSLFSIVTMKRRDIFPCVWFDVLVGVVGTVVRDLIFSLFPPSL